MNLPGSSADGPPVKVALNAGTLRTRTLEEQVASCARGGFQGFGAWNQHLESFLKAGHSLGAARELLRRHQLEVVEVDFLKDWSSAKGADLERALGEADRLAAMASELDCGLMDAATLGSEGALATAARNFGLVCDIAKAHGVQVGLEFLPWTSIPDIGTARTLLDLANRENGGLILDTFHFCYGGSRMEDLEGFPTEMIFLVHLDDVAEAETSDLVWHTRNRRTFPGEGVLPLADIVRTLVRKGYRGWYSLEILSEALDLRDPDPVAAEAFAASRAFFSSMEGL